MRFMINVPSRTRMAFLDSRYHAGHGGKFKYDWKFVCFNSLLESFRFSRDLQPSVKKDISDVIGEEAKMSNVSS